MTNCNFNHWRRPKCSFYLIIITVCACASLHLIPTSGTRFRDFLSIINERSSLSHNSERRIDGVTRASVKESRHIGESRNGGITVIVPSSSRYGESGGKPMDISEMNSSLCENVKLMPRGSMPVIALASLHGSGNTWLRQLIERVTGIYTGSIYNDPELISKGFRGESTEPYGGETVVVKMHEMHEPDRIDGTILLVRNLQQAIIAEFNRVQGLGAAKSSESHTFVVEESRFNTSAFRRCASILTNVVWKELINATMENFARTHKLLVVYYDDLKVDLTRQLKRIVEFLGLPLDEERLKCTLEESEGGFHRTRHLAFDPFDEEANDQIRSALEFANDSMESHELPPLALNINGSRRGKLRGAWNLSD